LLIELLIPEKPFLLIVIAAAGKFPDWNRPDMETVAACLHPDQLKHHPVSFAE
jgi:hypothetical protein